MLHDIPDNWQHGDLEKALKHVVDFDCALDCGAHRGVTVNYLLKRFAQVVAFEPSDLADKISPNAVVHKVALGDKVGQCAMADGKHNTGQRHVVSGEGIPIHRLDDYDYRPSFIKIDCEGMELQVIKGGLATIAKYRPVVMFEENGLSERYGVARGETGAFLQSIGMKRVLVLRQGSDEDWVYSW